MTEAIAESERIKYERIFKLHNYGLVGHARKFTPKAMQRMTPGSTVADFGCGRGASMPPFAAAGFKMIPVDHVSALSLDIAKLPNVGSLVKVNLWLDVLPHADYGLCTDVMEHIPESVVDTTLLNISKAVRVGCLWSICHAEDVFGAKINDRLHMTVKPHSWWLPKLQGLWRNVEIWSTSVGNSFYWTEH